MSNVTVFNHCLLILTLISVLKPGASSNLSTPTSTQSTTSNQVTQSTTIASTTISASTSTINTDFTTTQNTSNLSRIASNAVVTLSNSSSTIILTATTATDSGNRFIAFQQSPSTFHSVPPTSIRGCDGLPNNNEAHAALSRSITLLLTMENNEDRLGEQRYLFTLLVCYLRTHILSGQLNIRLYSNNSVTTNQSANELMQDIVDATSPNDDLSVCKVLLMKKKKHNDPSEFETLADVNGPTLVLLPMFDVFDDDCEDALLDTLRDDLAVFVVPIADKLLSIYEQSRLSLAGGDFNRAAIPNQEHFVPDIVVSDLTDGDNNTKRLANILEKLYQVIVDWAAKAKPYGELWAAPGMHRKAQLRDHGMSPWAVAVLFGVGVVWLLLLVLAMFLLQRRRSDLSTAGMTAEVDWTRRAVGQLELSLAEPHESRREMEKTQRRRQPRVLKTEAVERVRPAATAPPKMISDSTQPASHNSSTLDLDRTVDDSENDQSQKDHRQNSKRKKESAISSMNNKSTLG